MNKLGKQAVSDTDDHLTNILTGQLNSLPRLPGNVVKIFICSNANEFDVERKFLWFEVFPDLQQHCLQYGFDIIFIDMLLGNQNEFSCTMNDVDDRIHEIENCFADSVGPFFLAFIGDQYGNVPLPNVIDQYEFESILEAATKLQKNVELLKSWYRLDENSIPPSYVLHDDSDEMSILKRDISIDYLDILEIIQASVMFVGNKTRFRQCLESYFLSALERQIKHALWLSIDGGVYVFRTFQKTEHSNDLDTKRGHHNIHTESDAKMLTGETNAQRLSKLKAAVINKVPESNIIQLKCGSFQQHFRQNANLPEEYMDTFINVVTQQISQLIDKSARCFSIFPKPIRGSFDFVETLVHLQHCAKILKCSEWEYFDNAYMHQIEKLIVSNSLPEHQLNIIKGPDGFGKTYLIAKLCYRAHEILGQDTVVIPIFVDLTKKSLFAEDIFETICAQFRLILKCNTRTEDYSHNQHVSYFRGLVNSITDNSRQLLILLDDIEKVQFCKTDGIANLAAIDWLTEQLPPNCHIVVSCTSSDNSIVMQRIEKQLVHTDSIVCIKDMHKCDCEIVLNKILTKNRRKLQERQMKYVMDFFVKKRNSQIVTFMSDIVLGWKSWFNPERIENKTELLPSSIDKLLAAILNSVERKHGRTIIGSICIYMTLSRFGLTESELLDVLTNNDKVLLAAYSNSNPMILRFPIKIWISTLKELRPILRKRFCGTKTMYTWTHKSCITVIRNRYLTSHDESTAAHRDLANIFLEKENSRNPFIEVQDYSLTIEDVDRLLSPQPLVYSNVLYNFRKLHELWYNLLMSGDTESLKENTFCNFEYLLAMLDADNIQKVMDNLELVQTVLIDEEIHTLNCTLRAAELALHYSSLQLANELIGRLRCIKEYFPRNIEPLVSQCMEWCDNYTLPLLVPLTTWLDKVHIPLVTSMTFELEIACAALMPNGQHVILASGNLINMYHIATQRKVKTFRGHEDQVVCVHLDPVARILCSGAKDGALRVWDIDSENCMTTIRTQDMVWQLNQNIGVCPDKRAHCSFGTHQDSFRGPARDINTCITCLTSLRKEQMACGTENGAIVILDIGKKEVVITLKMHSKKVTAMKLCKAGTILISGSLDRKIIVWYTTEWTHMNIIDGEQISPVLCLDVSNDSIFLIAGCDNGSMHVIAVATGTVAQTMQSHVGNITFVFICNDSHHCVATSSSGYVYLYNFRTTEILEVFKGHNTGVVSVLLTENQQLAVTISKSELFVWSLLKRYTRETFQNIHSGPINCLVITCDGKKLISGGYDGFLRSWNLDISDFGECFIGHTGPITCLGLPNDNSFIVSGSTDTTLKVWSLAHASIITTYKGHNVMVNGVYVLSENKLILSLDASQLIHLWRGDDGKTIRFYSRATSLHDVDPMGKYCICGAGDSRLQIWNLSDGSVIKDITHTETITCLKCSCDSMYLVTGSQDKSIKVWELETGKLVQVIVDQTSTVRCMVITKDNGTVLSAGDDGAIHVCSLDLGSIEKKLNGHFDRVTCLKLTADDSILISGSMDHTIRVWNYRRCTQLTMFNTHYPVINIVVTDVADRICVQLTNNNNVPILCLHNSPATSKPTPKSSETVLSLTSISRSSVLRFGSTTDSQQNVSSEFGSDEEYTLPIKSKVIQRHRITSIRIPRLRRKSSTESSIPEIVLHSPIRAPITSTVKAQEKKRVKFGFRRSNNKEQNRKEAVENRRSDICKII